MKWLLLVLACLGIAVVVIAWVGASLPRAHVVTRSASFGKTPHQLHAIVRDFAAAPSWRSGVKSVELLPSRDGCAYYRETSRHGAITYCVLEDKPGERLVTEIADPDLPFGGTWTYEFVPEEKGARTMLRITERGEVKNVIFRFLARFVFGYAGTMESYLRDLGRKTAE